MDTIASAIISALLLGIISGTLQVGHQIIVDSYENLKNFIKNKFGEQSEIFGAIESLEKKPDSVGRQQILQEEIETVKADKDPEIMSAAVELLKQLQNLDTTSKNNQIAIGSNIAQSNSNSKATVSVRNIKDK
jgi:predicted house-cleaning noncanonical NTP pyrophosphatase (MazG superfamily)